MKILNNLYKSSIRNAVLLLVVASMSHCGKDDGPEPQLKSSAKQITSFKFLAADNPSLNEDVVAVINEGTKTISAILPGDTPLKTLTPTIVVSEMANLTPTGTQDFTNPVEYVVTAADGSEESYVVTASSKSSAKLITSFVFLHLENPIDINVEGVIDEEQKTITANMPPDTPLDGLLPHIEISTNATVSPNEAQDFNTPVEYTVSAEDGSQTVYTTIVTVALSQRQILQAILDANPANTLGWDLENTPDIGVLAGVTTDAGGTITTMDLEFKHLTAFNSEIGQLTELTYLDCRGNQISSIPREIGQLTSLTTLNFQSNLLTSLPPEIGQLKSLTTLSLTYNQLTDFPLYLTELSSLIRLGIAGNNLTSLPPELQKLTELKYLVVYENKINSVPIEIGLLNNLEQLDLHQNQLTSVPRELGKLTNLNNLSLGNNQLTSLPSEIWQLTNLESFSLGDNDLNLLPSEIGLLTKLRIFSIANNQLNSLPSEIWQLTDLESLHIHGNSLNSIPLEIGQLTELKILNIFNNQLTSLPPEIGFLTKLTRLSVTGNNLNVIPQSICNLKDFNNPNMDFFKDDGIVCKTISEGDALINIYSANPGNTLGWKMDHFPGVTFWSDGSPRLIEIADKGIQRINGGVGTFSSLRLLDVRNNPLTFIAPEVCKLQAPTGVLTILADSGEGCD